MQTVVICKIKSCNNKVSVGSHLCGKHAGELKHYRGYLRRFYHKAYPTDYILPQSITVTYIINKI